MHCIYYNYKTSIGIPNYLSDDIERVQRRALRIILPSLSYNDARELTDIP